MVRNFQDRLRPRAWTARHVIFASASLAKRTRAVSKENGYRVVVCLGEGFAWWRGDDVRGRAAYPGARLTYPLEAHPSATISVYRTAPKTNWGRFVL